MNAKVKKYLTVMTLGLAGGSIYFLPYIKYIFYDAQIASMGITNTQSGLLLTMYTIGNMILYIPGGIIADKVSPKKALVVSLLDVYKRQRFRCRVFFCDSWLYIYGLFLCRYNLWHSCKCS